MIPKKYFEDNRIPIDPNYIFVLLPYELQHIYEEGIQKPVKSINDSMRVKLVCENSLDIKGSGNIMADVWYRILKAQVIIADITGLNPNVMYELGVALTQKDNVVIICDMAIRHKADIPFDINHLRIDFYDPKRLDDLSTKLIQTITEILKTAGFKTEFLKNPEIKKLLKTANDLSRDKQWSAALALFEQMNRMEPKNWIVAKQWGVTYKMKDDYEAANQKFHEALEYATVNDQKSEIYTELALLHKLNSSDQALSFFRQAENLNSNNAFLYRQWAQFYEESNKYDEAMVKMQIAARLDNNDERNKIRLEYYTQKFLDPTLNISFIDFEAKKKGIKESPGPTKTTERNNNDDWDYFISKYKEGDVIDCTIDNINPELGIFVIILNDVSGLIHKNNLPRNFVRKYSTGEKIKVEVNHIDITNHRLDLLIYKKQRQRLNSYWDSLINNNIGVDYNDLRYDENVNDCLSIKLYSSMNVKEFISKISSIQSMYSEICNISNISEKVSPLLIKQIKSGSLWAELIGNKAIIAAIVSWIGLSAHYIYHNYTTEGKIKSIPKNIKSIEKLLNFSSKLKEVGINTDKLNENIQKAAISVSSELNTLLAGEASIEVNNFSYSIDNEKLMMKYKIESRELFDIES